MAASPAGPLPSHTPHYLTPTPVDALQIRPPQFSRSYKLFRRWVEEQHSTAVSRIRFLCRQSVESDELSAELSEEELEEDDEEFEEDAEEPQKAKRNKVANTVPTAGTTMEFPHP